MTSTPTDPDGILACEHGRQRRKCPVCQRDEELAALRDELARVTIERDAAKEEAAGACGYAHDMERRAKELESAIAEHHRQKADDRCIEDDDRLYASAGLPPCDRRVGDKDAMLANCARFIDRRCEGGKWPSYAELESALAAAVAERDAAEKVLRLVQSRGTLWESVRRKVREWLAAFDAARQTAKGEGTCQSESN